MSRNEILNFILNWLNENGGVSTKSYSEIIEPTFPEISPTKHHEYLTKLKSDGYVEYKTGFGKWNFEVRLTDNGRIFLSKKGYKEYSERVLSIIDNEKALDNFIKIYNQCYFKNITFDEFQNIHLKNIIHRSASKQLIPLLFNQGFLEGLPIDISQPSLTIGTIKRQNKHEEKSLTKYNKDKIKTISWRKVWRFITTIALILGALASLFYILEFLFF
jgi:hypothetical protein